VRAQGRTSYSERASKRAGESAGERERERGSEGEPERLNHMYSEYNGEGERFNHTYITTYCGERLATTYNCIGTLASGFVCTHERGIEGEGACAYAPLTIRCPKLHRETWPWLVLAGAQHVASPVTIHIENRGAQASRSHSQSRAVVTYQVCCSVLQHVTVCCIVFWFKLLQCVAVCCKSLSLAVEGLRHTSGML